MSEPHFAEGQFDAEAVRELGKLVDQVINVPSKRRQFRSDPITVAQNEGIEVTDKLARVILTLAEMSPQEMRLLSDLNRLLIAEGLYIETGNPPLMVY